MKRSFALKCSVLTVFALFAGASFAAGGGSGPAVKYNNQGHIGEVVVNPYRIAPLTAVIRTGGYQLSDVTVRIVPKKNGQEIKYTVADREILTHGGVPVFGLYPDHLNTVEVSYTRHFKGKAEKFNDTFKMWAAPVYIDSNGNPDQMHAPFDVDVLKTDKKFSDRLYFVNNLIRNPAQSSRAIWNNPMGGALEWNNFAENAIIDSTGAVRWYLHADLIHDVESIYRAGIMMGFQQTPDGALSWGYGQRYVKYDILGRQIYDRRLPASYNDISHSVDVAQNGNTFMRVASADLRRLDNKRVRTVRDVIVEVDSNGKVVDEWRLFDILDPYRDIVLKSLDQGAVCLNVDASKAGQTLTAEDLAKQDESNEFGDIPGVGPGRNWAHVNSVDYDPSDDSIIISSRHQSAIIKIGRDKKVKWILGAADGWKDAFKKNLLQPVDAEGKPIKCERGVCEKGFDFTWTQHTAFRIDSKSDKNVIYVSAFDNGDGRGLEQPALAEMKYTRGVVYKIDQRKMTVEQVYEVGKECGHACYSPITGLARYMQDKDSFMVYYSTAGLNMEDRKAGKATSITPFITEYRWGDKEPTVKIRLNDTMGYQAFPFDLNKLFQGK